MMLKHSCVFIFSFLLSSTLFAASMQELTSAKTALRASEEFAEEAIIDDEIGQHSLGISFGQTSLLGSYKHRGKSNELAFGFLYNFTASYAFDLLIDLHYSNHEKNKQYVTLPGLSIGIKAKLWQMDAFYPFILGGLGFYLPYEKQKKPDDSFVKSSAKLVMGFHGGLGGELRLKKNYTVGAMAVLHKPFKSEQDGDAASVSGAYWRLLLTFTQAI